MAFFCYNIGIFLYLNMQLKQENTEVHIIKPKRKIGSAIVREGFYFFFFLIFFWVFAQLFFESYVQGFEVYIRTVFLGRSEVQEQITSLRVIYPEEIASLEPTIADPATRQRLVNIYEPLVKRDRDLNMKPALALSWGLIDDLTWEFRLRPDVLFHDGSTFEAEDVVASMKRAQSHSSSELQEILDSVDKLEVVDSLNLRIITKQPDPLLLQKLSRVLIIPSELVNKEVISPPVGTASYKFFSWAPGDKMVISKYKEYWGPSAKFEEVELFARADKSERVNMFLNGGADILTFVPYDAVNAVFDKGFEFETIPTLEVQFLLFNQDSKILDSAEKRLAISKLIDQNSLVNDVGGYARAVSQFVSTGVFGFNPNIADHEFNLEEGLLLVFDNDLEGATVQFHLQKGLDVLGEQVRKKLFDGGIFAIVSYLELDDLLASMENGDADIYFLAFKSELGDSSDFLDTIIHSGGDFNIINYSNESVDFLIDRSLSSLNQRKRRDDLQEAMKIIVEDDVVGVPLFEYENVFSFVKDLDMVPRIDGLLYFDELIVK